jgi:V/A-type H+-transporting ATPase subunit I
MVRLDILAPRRSGEALLRAVHRTGVVHLVPFEAPAAAELALFGLEPAGAPLARSRRLLDQLTELRAVLGVAPVRPADIAGLWDLDLAALERRVADLSAVRAEAGALAAERQGLAAAAAQIARYRELIEGLERVAGRVPVLPGYATAGIIVGGRDRAVLPLLREELEATTAGRCELVAGDLDRDRVAALLVFPLRDAPAVASLIGSRNLEEIALPDELAGARLGEIGPGLAERLDRLAEQARACDERLARLAAGTGPLTAALAEVVADRVAELEALGDAGVSDHLVCVGGWVPADAVERLRAGLRGEVGDTVVVEERPSGERPPAGAPVAFRNRRFARAFEPLTTFVAVPRYGTLDPTPLLALFVPAFIGLMIGDAGYGLVFLALLGLVRWRLGHLPLVRDVWPIGLAAAIATIAFGVLFGEWFGDLGGRTLGLEPIWMSREESFIPLLELTIAIGIGQVGLGLLLGAANAARLHRRREALGRVAMAVVLGTGLVALGSLAGLLPRDVGVVALVALGGAVVIATLSLGAAGPVEALGLAGRVLSYARLTAIGLASVTLAVVANRLGGLVENVVVGALIALLLHALNLAIGVFDASIQGLRLQYVEFFGTFFEAGGVQYAPFRSALDRPADPSPAGSPGGS